VLQAEEAKREREVCKMDDVTILGIVLAEIFAFTIGIIIISSFVGYTLAIRLKKKNEVKKEGA
jgi:hypothetical protein